MTIGQAIDQFDRLQRNQIQIPIKVVWLSTLDGLIHRELLGGRQEDFSGYSSATDLDTGLLVPYPYDEIYRWFLEMKTWDTLGDMTRYNNAAQKYNSVLLAYGDHVNRNRDLGTPAPLKLI